MIYAFYRILHWFSFLPTVHGLFFSEIYNMMQLVSDEDINSEDSLLLNSFEACTLIVKRYVNFLKLNLES